MKLAVLADIHANLAALETVAAHIEVWQPDIVIVAGDVVNRGTRPLECLRFVQKKVRTEGWLTARGNHEDYVIYQSEHLKHCSPEEREFYRFTHWTCERLNGQVQWLAAMPFQQSLSAPDGGEIRVVHASMRSTRDGIFVKTSDEQLRQQIMPPPDLFCVGHTHWPLIRQIDDTLVVNVGAVGLPFDRDIRASYAQLVWQAGSWHPNIVRLPYDLARAECDFVETGFLEEGGPLAYVILDELHTARSHLFWWTRQYQVPVLAGKMTMADAVQQFMADL